MSEEKIEYPKEFLDYVNSISNRRAKIVIDHILEYGFITTEDLETTYGYSHPPRAARDVREAGIPLETFSVKSNNNKSIAAYRFGDISLLQKNRVAGRIIFPKELKRQLNEIGIGRCFICNAEFNGRYLQVDHRIPYQVGGDIDKDRSLEHFMLLCGSCNRAKSWSCEHCINWTEAKKPEICLECYWGSPTHYSNIATKDIRRLDIQWTGDEVKYYDAIRIIAEQNKIELPEFVKKLISDQTRTN